MAPNSSGLLFRPGVIKDRDYVGVVWQMIMVYHESWVIKLGSARSVSKMSSVRNLGRVSSLKRGATSICDGIIYNMNFHHLRKPIDKLQFPIMVPVEV